MVELIKDERVVEVIGECLQITRTVVEKFDAEEYIRKVNQIERQIEMMDSQSSETKGVFDIMNKFMDAAKKIRDYELEKAKEDRDDNIETGDLE